jgi:multidrug efflux system membrane fusion protein
LSPSDRVVTTGFANLAEGSKVVVGRDDQTPTADLAPRKRQTKGGGQKDGQVKDGQAKDGQGKDGQGERRGKRRQGEGDQTGPAGPAAGGDQSGSGAKSQP